MRFQFTPAADRAWDAAARWSRTGDGELQPVAALLGLLWDADCRAALLLTDHGIDAAAVQARWPELSEQAATAEQRRQRFSAELLESLAEAESRLLEHPQPLELATEHILLGLVCTPGEVGQWLTQRGFDATVLELQVHQFAGHDPGPLDWDAEIFQPAGTDLSPPTQDLPSSLEIDDEPTGEPIDMPLDLGPAEPIGSMELASSSEMQKPADSAVWRILDAAANRAAEGIRVVEDYVRFVLDDAHLARLAKELRHDLKTALESLPAASRIAARETQADVGAAIATAGELARGNAQAVAVASLKRTQQALRSLEEYAKLVDAQAAAQFERLRYRSYTLERAVLTTAESVTRLASASLYVLIDGRASEAEFVTLVDELVKSGVDVLQLRDKELGDRELLERARLLVQHTRGTSTLAIINDRPDIAALAQADGVHVGQEELSVKDARAIVGSKTLIGVSTHSIEQARRAVLDGASYIGVGPTFPSGTKQFAEFPGLALVQAVAAEIRLPAFVIGGVTAANLLEVLAAGATRVAVSGAVCRATSPGASARELKQMINANPKTPTPSPPAPLPQGGEGSSRINPGSEINSG